MYWKQPRIDDTRIKTRFLFFPKCINGKCVWWVRVSYRQKYGKTDRQHKVTYKFPFWSDLEWVDLT